MPLQNFVDNSLPKISAAWLNLIDAFYTTLFQGATTAAGARSAISAAQSGANTDITSLSAPALGAATATTQSVGTNSTKVATTAFVQAALGAMTGFRRGLVPSTAGSSATMTIAAGCAVDSTGAYFLRLASALSKTTSAWAVGTGNGGLDTGAIANSTWYHFWLIARSDTGVVDVLISTSATAPTMPTNYDYKRRIAMGLTNGSAQWTSFVADECGGGAIAYQWLTPTSDVSATNPGTSAVTRTLTTPTGVRTLADLHVGYAIDPGDGTTSGQVRISDLSLTDSAPGIGNAQLAIWAPAVGGNGNVVKAQVWTNTSAQVRSRVSASGANTVLTLRTAGWTDPGV